LGTGTGNSWGPAPFFSVVGSIVLIEVCDVSDAAIVSMVKRSIRDGVGHLAGKWHVRLSASAELGQWDLRLTGAFGHHVARFRATPQHLADCVTRRLRAFLRGVVPPLGPLGVIRHPTFGARRVHMGAVATPPVRRTRPRLVKRMRGTS
jgi:hypothetical protein